MLISESSIIIPETYEGEEEEEEEEEVAEHRVPSSPILHAMDPPHSQINNNNQQHSYDYSQPSSQFDPHQCSATQTQTEQTQSTQPTTSMNEWPSHLWGILISLNQVDTSTSKNLQESNNSKIVIDAFIPRPDRIELNWDQKLIKVGRHKDSDILLDSKKISSSHCEIQVEQGVDGVGTVKLKDISTNGTFVSGRKVGKGNTTILQAGDEIIFGPPTTSFSHDFRYTFSCPPTSVDSRFTSSGGGFFEKYELRDELGRGSFAIVRKAVQRKTGNTVAVKIISKSKFAGDPLTMAMFRREIEIMKTLDHPFCVGFVDFFEDEQKLWLVLELSDGGDLLSYIMDRAGLNESDTRQIALMICQAVDYLHSVGIAHRDIKPENILMSKGSRPLCKVGDFGLAKMIDAGTKWRTMCGTPTYLAPEIIADTTPTEGYSNAVDAWSLGIVIYSCLTNSTPFDESESTPLRERIEARVVDFSTLRHNGVSEIAIDFLSKFLTNDPNLRMTVHDSLSHPWLATTEKNGTKTLDALVSSTLPYNSRSQPITTGSTDSVNLGEDLVTITTGISAEGSSFAYSQQLGDLHLRSSLTSSLQSTTTPDRTMEVDPKTTTTVENESTIMPSKFNPQSLISPLGKRSREQSNYGTEPNSAFSSMSSIGTPYRSNGKSRNRNEKLSSTSETTLGGLGTAVEGLEVLSQMGGSSDSELGTSPGSRMIDTSFEVVEQEEDGQEGIVEPISTRTSRSRNKTKGVGGRKKAAMSKVVELQPEGIAGEGMITRRRAKAAKLS